MNSIATCRKCGMPAAYSTFGQMFEAKCSHCGYEEAGTFVSSIVGIPIAKPIAVRIQIAPTQPTAANLLWLSKLHKKFSGLSPQELKAAFLAAPILDLGELHAEEAERIKALCFSAGFQVFLRE